MATVQELARQSKKAARALAAAGTNDKNGALNAVADALWARRAQLLAENARDLERARASGMRESLLDRLTLTEARIGAAVDGVRKIAALDDPVGQVDAEWTRPNGLRIGRRRVPLGVVGIIYEARPNVTVDAAALCLKAGDAVLLRGGKEAISSNAAIVRVMREALSGTGVPEDAVLLVEDTSRDSANAMMRANGLIDVLIPRGGAGLIRAVVENASVPVIQTGVGICHVYVDRYADREKAVEIVFNAKCSRPSVCNAMECLLVDRAVAADFLPAVKARLDEKHVELRGCPETLRILPGAVPATEQDYHTEFLDYIMAIRVVGSVEEAIEHIAEHGTGHSEAIVTENYTNANLFLDRVDAAAVYVNASTRFTDGFEFGFGAEMGISTQKLHARGPMGLRELTTTKYVIYGNGQVR